MMKADWQKKIRKLPKGLSYKEAARRLGQEYSLARKNLKAMKYPARDGRGRSEERRQELLKKFSGADWNLSNVALALQFGVSREWTRQVRDILGKPFVEARGRKAGGKNSVGKKSKKRA